MQKRRTPSNKNTPEIHKIHWVLLPISFTSFLASILFVGGIYWLTKNFYATSIVAVLSIPYTGAWVTRFINRVCGMTEEEYELEKLRIKHGRGSEISFNQILSLIVSHWFKSK